jgi:hypothetical protein
MRQCRSSCLASFLHRLFAVIQVVSHLRLQCDCWSGTRRIPESHSYGRLLALR